MHAVSEQPVPPEREGWTLALPRMTYGLDWWMRMAGWSAAAGAAVHLAWETLAPAGANWSVLPLASAKGLALFAGLVVVHELLHYISYPRQPGSRVTAGFSLSRGAVYLRYHGFITRERRLFIATLPFVALSLGTLALAVASNNAAPELAFIAFWNAIGSAGDLDNVSRIVRRVPRGAQMLQDDAGVWVRNPGRGISAA